MPHKYIEEISELKNLLMAGQKTLVEILNGVKKEKNMVLTKGNLGL